MAAWLRQSADKARAALSQAAAAVESKVGLEDYEKTFADDPETAYALRSVALLREDAKSLAGALERYRRAVEASVEGGVMELGLKGFAGTLVNIATRDSVKARNMGGLELRGNDPVADVKEAAIALGNVYRRAGDARLRLAARMNTYLASLVGEMEAAYLSEVKPLKKEYAAKKEAAAARAREAEHRAARAAAGGGAANASKVPIAQAEAPPGGPVDDWRPLSAMLRLKASSFTATFSPKVVKALHDFAAHEAASFQEVASELLPAASEQHRATAAAAASSVQSAGLERALASARISGGSAGSGSSAGSAPGPGGGAATAPRTPSDDAAASGGGSGSVAARVPRHSAGGSDASETSPDATA